MIFAEKSHTFCDLILPDFATRPWRRVCVIVILVGYFVLLFVCVASSTIGPVVPLPSQFLAPGTFSAHRLSACARPVAPSVKRALPTY